MTFNVTRIYGLSYQNKNPTIFASKISTFSANYIQTDNVFHSKYLSLWICQKSNVFNIAL